MMPRIDLTIEQRQVLVSWLYEPNGYLDYVSVGLGQSARDALVATPTLDLIQWKRDNDAGGWENWNAKPFFFYYHTNTQ